MDFFQEVSIYMAGHDRTRAEVLDRKWTIRGKDDNKLWLIGVSWGIRISRLS
jgi:hypothetical protein